MAANDLIDALSQLPSGLRIEIDRPLKGKHKGEWRITFTAVQNTLLTDSDCLMLDEDEFCDTVYDCVWGDSEILEEALAMVFARWELHKRR